MPQTTTSTEPCEHAEKDPRDQYASRLGGKAFFSGTHGREVQVGVLVVFPNPTTGLRLGRIYADRLDPDEYY
jgi:hypothetical protein